MIMDVYRSLDGKWHLDGCEKIVWPEVQEHLRVGGQTQPGGPFIKCPHQSELCTTCFACVLDRYK